VGSAAWLVLPFAGTVQPLGGDPIEVGDAPLRAVSTPQGLWVSVIRDGALVRIDPKTGKVDQRVQLSPRASEPEGLAYDGTSLWVVDQAGDRVLTLDPASGKVSATYPVGHEPRLVAVGPKGVYVANYSSGSITRVADGHSTTRNAAHCLTPQGIAVAGGLVWVGCTVDGAVVAYDAATLQPVARLAGLDAADAVVSDGSMLYAVGQSGPTVWVIDPTSREVVSRLTLGDAPTTSENVGAAVVGDQLVVTSPEENRAYEVPLSRLAPD
jgi:YVTN family beta-propeller protein